MASHDRRSLLRGNASGLVIASITPQVKESSDPDARMKRSDLGAGLVRARH